MLQNLIKSCVQSFGIDIVKYPLLSDFARQVRRLFQDAKIDLVLDVGACDGGFVRFMRGPIGYSGKIVSFEPTKSVFDKLSTGLQHDRRWSGLNIGISDKDGNGVLNTYPSHADFNSMLPLRADDARAFDVDLTRRGTETISLRSIDSLWDEITSAQPQPSVYLKTDTQGHDPFVISGATSHLKQIVAIQSEIAAIEIYDGMQPMHETLRSMASIGYHPIGFSPVNQPLTYQGMVPEFDVVFRRGR
jgi:FkbM family methyltransferase